MWSCQRNLCQTEQPTCPCRKISTHCLSEQAVCLIFILLPTLCAVLSTKVDTLLECTADECLGRVPPAILCELCVRLRKYMSTMCVRTVRNVVFHACLWVDVELLRINWSAQFGMVLASILAISIPLRVVDVLRLSVAPQNGGDKQEGRVK